MIGIVYKYTSPSGKSYIGQTIQGDKRKEQHRYNAQEENYEGYYFPFYCAIRKYGWDSFKYEVLITIEKDNKEDLFNTLNDLEIYYIGFYNSIENGYNISIGGAGLSSKCHPSNVKVAQYDLDGNYIQSFYSAAEAARTLNIDSSGIIKCCKFKSRKSGNCQWRYIKEDVNEQLPINKVKKKNSPKITYCGKNNKRSKKVYQYTLDKSFIREWDSIADIVREIGYDSGSISKTCTGKTPYYGKINCEKFIWSYFRLEKNTNDKQIM